MDVAIPTAVGGVLALIGLWHAFGARRAQHQVKLARVEANGACHQPASVLVADIGSVDRFQGGVVCLGAGPLVAGVGGQVGPVPSCPSL